MTATYADTRPIDASFHHGSHRQLLAEVPMGYARPTRIEALIVPTARPVDWLREAMGLARDLDSILVAACSKLVSADEVLDLGATMNAPTITIDVNTSGRLLPALSTDRLLNLTRFDVDSDVNRQRNLALLVSRLVGWRRVLFLDDDIYGVKPGEACAAAGLLSEFDAVGLHNTGYPDNSVVCHVHRELGAEQEQFVGAGALAVSPLRARSFFPNTYNQDWLYLLGEGQPPGWP